MSGQAAYPATISVGGAAQTFTQQATTKLTANTRYQITTAADRRVDPATNVTVEVDADGGGAGGYVTADPSTYSVDYLYGIVTFASDQGASAVVRVSGKYIPILYFALAREVTLTLTNDVQDLALFGDGYKKRKITLSDLAGTIGILEIPTTDLDSGAGTVKLQTFFDAGSALFLEINKGGGAPYFRAWIKIPELGHKLAEGSLYECNLKFVGHAFQASGQTEYVAWGYGS